jgi:hypothetical protein
MCVLNGGSWKRAIASAEARTVEGGEICLFRERRGGERIAAAGIPAVDQRVVQPADVFCVAGPAPCREFS